MRSNKGDSRSKVSYFPIKCALAKLIHKDRIWDLRLGTVIR